MAETNIDNDPLVVWLESELEVRETDAESFRLDFRNAEYERNHPECEKE